MPNDGLEAYRRIMEQAEVARRAGLGFTMQGRMAIDAADTLQWFDERLRRIENEWLKNSAS